MSETTPTGPQLEFIKSLREQAHVTERTLDALCFNRYGVPPAEMTRRQVSELIDLMKTWAVAPAELQREAGQKDLF